LIAGAEIKTNKNHNWQQIFGSMIDTLPNILLWVKDLDGRFLMVNENLVHIHGFHSKQDILDKKDIDITPRYLAEGYMLDDQKVIQSLQKIKDRIELIQNPDGTTAWYKTTKLPIFDDEGKWL